MCRTRRCASRSRRPPTRPRAYNGFTKWLHFGNAGWLASRASELRDKAVKFLDVLASSRIFSTTVDMTHVLRRMAREGWTLSASDLTVLSPYRRENVLRFGDYTTDQLHIAPPACNPTLHSPENADAESAARPGPRQGRGMPELSPDFRAGRTQLSCEARFQS
ncbi:Tn3 family transposase, partial [Kitasatospora sp. NPDC085895]|uniref:Tn3 family transposase n=1 Tax=Kitasatospora sp. NPDC085895 TaxID=3155057 RepID=UPI0034504737